MTNTDTGQNDAEKWNRIYSGVDRNNDEPATVLKDYLHLLPEKGHALDLACGLGGNALLLSKQGLETFAWDISETAISKVLESARRSQLNINTEIRDIVNHPPEPESFDVIVVARFLDRGLIPHLIKALRPRGLLYYQTFIKEKTNDIGPRNPDYLLGCNELLELFKSLHIILYREEAKIGNLDEGFRNEAMLIAQKG